MRPQSTLASALLLLLRACMAAPTAGGGATAALPPRAGGRLSERCMSQFEIAAFRASWPAAGGSLPELVACEEGAGLDRRSPLSPPEIEDLVRRHLGEVRQTPRRSAAEAGRATKRCMSDEEIKQILENWPPNAGKGPALVPCDNQTTPYV